MAIIQVRDWAAWVVEVNVAQVIGCGSDECLMDWTISTLRGQNSDM